MDLAKAGDRASFMQYMDAYVTEQKELGRFDRPLNNRLHDVMAWLKSQEVVGDGSRLQTWLAFGFLLVCLGVVAWIFRTGYRLKS